MRSLVAARPRSWSTDGIVGSGPRIAPLARHGGRATMVIAWIVTVLAGVLVSVAPAGAGERFLAQPKLATDCQSALIAATTPFAQTKLKQLDKCATAAFKCIETVAPNDDADVDPIDAC